VRDYKCVGRIVKVRELENRPGNYEHRIEYTNIDEDDREDIIHYIFEEERKLMRRG
jgi:c-di-GMP-binding flagellar brake protein YcgR